MSRLFVNCDWGTTRLRLRLVAAEGATILAEVQSDQGVAGIAAGCEPARRPEQFRKLLAEALRRLSEQAARPLPAMPIVISGMASSSIGWHELPYARVPWHLDGSDLIWQELDAPGDEAPRRTILISGARTATDVMRGEETEAVGLFQLQSARALIERATAILPGTHSKHLRIEAGRVIDFRTYMTGELLEVLARHSILRHSIGADDPTVGDFSALSLAGDVRDGFLAGVEHARRLPLSAALFQVRTRQVLAGADIRTGRAMLSGILIGSELASLAGDETDNTPIVLGAARSLAPFYTAALEYLGLLPRSTMVAAADVERLSALGQACLARRLGLL